MPKKDIHPKYYKQVEVLDVSCGKTILINAAVKGPIKVESSSASHPAYNKGKVVEKKAKGRLQAIQEKMERMKNSK